jgi:hypothetical protein
MPGNDFYAVPGDTVTVEVETDPNGTVATEGDAVELVGSYQRNPLVEQVNTRANDVGVLLADPADFTSQSDHSAGDKVGRAKMALAKRVIPVLSDSGYTPSIGDYVTALDGGGYSSITGPVATSVGTLTNTLGVDGSGNLEHDGGSDIELDITGGFPTGVVFDADIPEFGARDMAIAMIR